ncbi:hypothetical protein SME02_004678 [Klebsiella aerogenes]|nr:hypothetical protein [Klebsiella aerogenes]ELY3087594.1 hypothetical protein [Klebsiella aerogenes]
MILPPEYIPDELRATSSPSFKTITSSPEKADGKYAGVQFNEEPHGNTGNFRNPYANKILYFSETGRCHPPNPFNVVRRMSALPALFFAGPGAKNEIIVLLVLTYLNTTPDSLRFSSAASSATGETSAHLMITILNHSNWRT